MKPNRPGSGTDPLPQMRGGWIGLPIWTALIALAVLVRLLSAIANPVIQRDGVLFLTLAREAAEGDLGALFRTDQHPLYPAAVALARPVAGDWEIAGLAVSIVAGALTVIPAVLLGRRMAGRQAGLLGGAVFAVSRYPVRYGASVLSDGLHVLLFAFAAWAGAVALGLGRAEGCDPASEERCRDGRSSPFGPPWSFVLAGLLAGIAYLVRPEGLIIIAALGVGSLVRLLGALSRDSLRRLAVGGLCLAVPLAATVGPYAAHLSAESGRFTLTKKKALVQTVLGEKEGGGKALPPSGAPAPGEAPPPPPAPPPATPPAPSPAPGAAAQTPGASPAPAKEAGPHRVLARLEGMFVALGDFVEAVGYLPFGLLVIGLLSRRAAREPSLGEVYVLAAVAIFMVLLSGIYTSEGYAGRRHCYPLTPLVTGLCGAGIVVLGSALARGRACPERASKATLILAALALVVMLPKSTGLIPESGRGKDLWTRQGGIDLRALVSPEDRVLAVPGDRERRLSETARIAFYTGGKVVSATVPASAPLPAILAEGDRLGARWAIVDGIPGAPGRDPPPGWELSTSVPYEDREARVYRKK
jgi:hypothetical protein